MSAVEARRPAHASMPERRVLPQGVFVARRQSFDCIVLGATSVHDAALWIWEDLPLAANGWDPSTTKITQTDMSFGERTFRVERG